MNQGIPEDMIAIVIAVPGGPDVLQPTTLPVPKHREDEVLIRVAAAGVNAPDLAQRRGVYDPPPGHSPVPGLEVSGEIVAVGQEVDTYKPGDRVVALTNGSGYAEFVAVPAGQVLPLPSSWSFAEGAALPETFFTVEQTLVMRAGLTAGMVVLIHGGAGGIGGAAIQAAKLRDARPIAVVSSPEKAAYASSLGAVATINHREEDFVGRVKELTDGHGADRIIDMMAGETVDRNIAAAARGGHIVVLASLAGAKAQVNMGSFLAKQLTMSGSTLRPQPPEAKAAIARHLFASTWPALTNGTLVRPRTTTFPLRHAADAHKGLENRSSLGKFVLVTAFGASL